MKQAAQTSLCLCLHWMRLSLAGQGLSVLGREQCKAAWTIMKRVTTNIGNKKLTDIT